MSQFVGPIHHWLYRKILFQESLVQSLGQDSQALKDADHLFGKLPEGQLEDHIDEGNIHGWLQEQIQIVEKRLAYVYDHQKNQDTLQDIETFARQYQVEGDSPKAIFDELQNLLLDGMPCDRVNQLMDHNSHEITWQMNQDIHYPYWNELGIQQYDYFLIRDALIKGLLNNPWEYQHITEKIFYIRRAFDEV